jgi:hypothetical protein
MRRVRRHAASPLHMPSRCRAGLLWRDRSFRTLAAAMALSLFAQAG